ncbi:STAS domain-containing protein [Nitrosococcus wardiae]|uniref:Anti-sigma factor antagonist n=1 Tax=Nitrosococcus wardiae TaxID=1814290 RepID=A0A4P7BYH0_9GAMM|nr:STAS domain-containing protein [Nitrosococcus wardiae]QBQ55111.1 anti-sigma factor antagonist [Nitrosococcus wardiae]
MLLATHLAAKTVPLSGVKAHAHTVTLTLPPILDSALCREFWEAAQQARDTGIKVIIDLEKTLSIRDSGYTLLWMLKDSLDKEPADLLLVGCHPALKRALQLRGFGPHFTLL